MGCAGLSPANKSISDNYRVKIFDPWKNEIGCFDDWARIFTATKKKRHWKPGRGAHSLAEFILNHRGAQFITDIVSETLNDAISLDLAYIEQEIRFDQYGHGREHDLGIYGTTSSGKSIFIGLEAKVDEPFGDFLSASYLKSKAKELSGVRTNSIKRIDQLIKDNFEDIDESVFDLRHQLLYATVGTIAVGADISVLLVLVFKTKLYDELRAIDNFKDYLAFMLRTNAVENPTGRKDTRIHKLKIREKELISIYSTVEIK